MLRSQRQNPGNAAARPRPQPAHRPLPPSRRSPNGWLPHGGHLLESAHRPRLAGGPDAGRGD